MKSITITATALALLALAACSTLPPPENPQGVHGMIAVKSSFDVKTTMDRFEAVIKAKDMATIARIDHAAGATRVGATLRPTEVLIWGSPKTGTPMLVCSQTVGIDLPQKTLVWQDAKGDVYLGWNDPEHLVATRHETPGCDAITKPIGVTIRAWAKLATQP